MKENVITFFKNKSHKRLTKVRHISFLLPFLDFKNVTDEISKNRFFLFHIFFLFLTLCERIWIIKYTQMYIYLNAFKILRNMLKFFFFCLVSFYTKFKTHLLCFNIARIENFFNVVYHSFVRKFVKYTNIMNFNFYIIIHYKCHFSQNFKIKKYNQIAIW